MGNDKIIKGCIAVGRSAKNRLPVRQRIVVIMVLLVGCVFFYSCRRPPESTGRMEKVTLGISKSFLSVPVYIAKAQGYFAAEGLDITIREYPSGKLATKAMLADEIEISTIADLPIVFNGFNRRDFCIFATFTSSYHFVKIIARQDKGIKNGADLHGKKVGVNRGTSSHFFLGTFLTNNRLSIDDVEMVQRKTVDLPKALLDNEVEAISVWQPYAEKAQQALGGKARELPSPEIYRTTFSFAAKKNFAKERREILEKLLRAVDQASLFIQENRGAAQDLVASALNVEKEIVNRLWDDYTFGISVDQALLLGLDDIARWAMENQFTDHKEIPNFLDYIYLDALEAVKPEAVTIIR